ncbi:inducible nitrate reductase [NADH] 2-like isoform X1 [Trichoplusia ni]|uniref:Cytochrome b5 n=1 Tax=Trichoplusia ni TaxID=7111 RepID=A0A7E5WL61_TRINI|nr:inducible nitrate reductase [NADH] 2-like isoform X1 [Trichoplusia ni]
MTTHYITASEVKKHNTRRSVWLVIRNEVYDVTAFLNEHPGGEDPLLDAAGLDATIAFDDVGHSEDAVTMLKKYKIGTLAPGETCSKMKPKIWKSRSIYHRDCTECDASSCPSAQIAEIIDEKPWRTFDGSPSSQRLPMKTDYKPPSSPRVVRRVQSIVVPRERPRGYPCSDPSSRLKWALLALAGAIVIGLAYKKYAAGLAS